MPPFYVFVHMPKTGGTSLRHAAAAHFGDERMLYDYGVKARLTSDLVREWMYERKDPAGFALAAREGGFRFLSGHFQLSRYLRPFEGANFLTWMREPTQRVWSAFRHHRRHHGFEGTLEAFYQAPAFRNHQSRMMAPGAEHFDFIGILERNDDSLSLLQRSLGLRLRERRANRAPEDDQPTPPTEQDWRRMKRLNDQDMVMYASALARFD